MATIKPIEGSSVHQIQSGQVITDLLSVTKELLENALDASATSLEIRLKNHGLDSIEVVDNGTGISPDDFESLCLKHYTSKIERYGDLEKLGTFGFRGEALSSLCAVSKVSVVTCREGDVPKGWKLEFETSGKLKGRSVVAATRGTSVTVSDIFANLPVRRRELEKNVKREYGKVLGLLHAYACISTGVRFSVSNTTGSGKNGKKIVVFSTKSNPTTRENIANVYGAKTLLALIPLDLTLELNPTTASTQSAHNWTTTQADMTSRTVKITGHISRPSPTSSRQTPDRQMLFVNSRPCALPQVSKAINEVYKSYMPQSAGQSPFIFANLELDTGSYDVNVSPDKRTILLHDQGALLEALKESLVEMFEREEQTVPVNATPSFRKLPSYKPLSVTKRLEAVEDEASGVEEGEESSSPDEGTGRQPSSILRRTVEGDDVETREHVTKTALAALAAKKKREVQKAEKAEKSAAAAGKESPEKENEAPTTDENVRVDSLMAEKIAAPSTAVPGLGISILGASMRSTAPTPSLAAPTKALPKRVQDFNAAMGVDVDIPVRPDLSKETVGFDDEDEDEAPAEEDSPQAQKKSADVASTATREDKIPSVSNTPRKVTPGVVPNAFDRMRPKRTPQDVATITIGDQSTVMTLGTPEAKRRRIHTPKQPGIGTEVNGSGNGMPGFVSSLKAFGAPGTGTGTSDDISGDEEGGDDVEDEEHEENAAARPNSFSKPQSRPKRTLPTSSMTTTTTNTITDLSSEALDLSDRPLEQSLDSALFLASDDNSDSEYMDEAEKKAREEAKVAKLIELAEERAAKPSSDHVKRAASVMRGRSGGRKDATLMLEQVVKTDVANIGRELKLLGTRGAEGSNGGQSGEEDAKGVDATTKTAEDRLSLTVSKSDFARMRIIGQFNLGFILATRSSSASASATETKSIKGQDELFIIDQHASDEKYNFERLQAQTIVQSQRLVHPKQLDLTAIEEEVVIEDLGRRGEGSGSVLEKNGFEIEVDESGDVPVGQRCRLVSLPMSREVTFNLSDLEELLALLSENPASTTSSTRNDTFTPRPSKVRKMFAMRACRSSIMVGKTLTGRQMERVVRHMGELDKPWNCPHGRPTMRHLFSMASWTGWEEGDGLVGMEVKEEGVDWGDYVKKGRDSGLLDEEEEGEGEAEDEMMEDGDDPEKWLFTQQKEGVEA